MPRGWRSPLGQWSRGSVECKELTVVKRFVESLLPTDNGLIGYDFEAFFNIMSQGGEILSHNNIEASSVVVYHVEGRAALTFQAGVEVQSIATVPGLIAIFPAFLKQFVKPISCSQYVSIELSTREVRRVAA